MTGTEERITSAYHPQLCKRQNRIIKDSLIEVLEEKAEHLTKVINRIHLNTESVPILQQSTRHFLTAQ